MNKDERSYLWKEIYLPLLWYPTLPIVLALAGHWEWALILMVFIRLR